MAEENLQNACDRLSRIVDAGQFERMRWERDIGPKLARLVELAQSAFAGRKDFEMVEEGATRDVKRYVIKVHGNRVLAISLRLASGQAVAASEAIERSKYRVADGPPISADFAEVDEQWMTRTMQALLGRVQEPQAPADAANPA